MVGSNTTTTLDIVNRDAMKRLRTLNTKTEFMLKRSISHDIFKHIIHCKSASEIWITLDALLNKTNMAQVQYLQNDLINTI